MSYLYLWECIELDERTQTTGVILCDQAKMLNIGTRNAQFKEKCFFESAAKAPSHPGYPLPPETPIFLQDE